MAVFGGFGSGFKPGMVIGCGNNQMLPDGFLWCDGAAVSRTLYADLFAVIGTNFGAGDGSTTFNLPSGFLRLMGDTAPAGGNGRALVMTNGSGGYYSPYEAQELSRPQVQFGTDNVGGVLPCSGGGNAPSGQNFGVNPDVNNSGLIASIALATYSGIALAIKY